MPDPIRNEIKDKQFRFSLIHKGEVYRTLTLWEAAQAICPVALDAKEFEIIASLSLVDMLFLLEVKPDRD